ncbi:LLM class flavin-dependent oxidoreductase [Sphaerisporangium perillae]|uniref:LLM class flavin-dependent oxidoreductase n=1 Tax=Sphaerisporangium perillae TaxID=2935860 RepID=UPI00200F33DF|nr:LLM class flavin-dependent oxidoreductase [Sphaerisporangium perillae]
MTRPSFHWFLPMYQDQRAYADDRGIREATPRYIKDVARAAEAAGLESLLLATGHGTKDTWLTAALAAQDTQTIRFIVAFRTGYTLPTLTAQMIETFQYLFDDRLDINIVTGSDPDEQQAYGDEISKETRYQRTREFVQILEAEFAGQRYDFAGDYYQVSGGGRRQPISRRPTVFFGGLSEEAAHVGAAHADVQLMYGETPPMAAEHVERISKLAETYGRRVEFGIRIQVISRDRSEDAWAETDRILSRLTPEQVARRQRELAERQSIGQQRVQSLNPGVIDRERLRPYPTIWSGLGLVGGGGGSTALVGSHEEVAERIQEYVDAGIRHFIVSGAPLLEEAYRFGEGVLPLL